MLPRYVEKATDMGNSVAGWQGSQVSGRGKQGGGVGKSKGKPKQFEAKKGCHMCQMTFACGNDNDFSLCLSFSLPRRDNNEMQTKKGQGTAAHEAGGERVQGLEVH